MRISYLWFLTLLLVFSCEKKSASGDSNSASDKVEVPADALFRLLPASQTGVVFQNSFKEDYKNNIFTNGHLYNGGGVGVLDVNRDGLQDLFFTATLGKCKLFLNKGNLKFEDITDAAGVAAPTGIKTGVAVADVNGDGWQDFYVCRSGLFADDNRRNLLFINQKNNTFKEMSKVSDVDDPSATSMSNFFDYDHDGDLDLYNVSTQVNFARANTMNVAEIAPGKYQRSSAPKQEIDSDKLYRNEGPQPDGSVKFTEVTKATGVFNNAYGLSATSVDFNDDNFTDLYVGNDFIEPDFFYINNKNGTFSEKINSITRHYANHTMGADIADINNDGLADIFSLDMLPEDWALQQQRVTTMKDERYYTLLKNGYGHQLMRNVLQLNNGNGTFSDIACLAGVYQTDWSWAPIIQDFDLDGWRDFYITNGYYRDVTNADYMEFTVDSLAKLPGGISEKRFPDIETVLQVIPQFKLLNYAYRNRGDLTFEDVSIAWGLAEKSYSNGAAYTDLDNDGDLDLVVNNMYQDAFIYQNTAADRKLGNWLQIRLEGSPKNAFAVGAKIRAWAGNQVFTEELTPFRGFFSSVEPLVHFGLGKISSLDRVEVFFPEGKIISQTNVPVNQRLTIKFSDAKPGKLTPLPAPKPFAKDITGLRGLNFSHLEDEFQDFNRERLLPWKLSAPGPALAVGDVNGDGLPDVYVGGATNQAGALFLQNAGGNFTPTSTATWEQSKAHEDAGAVFFDLEKDGDLDLFVASGGNAQPAGNPIYQPRVYVNDGKGNFALAPGAVPSMSESTAAAAAHDFDSDGDADIFLGGYCVPAAYPTAPTSRILKNENGRLLDVTRSVSPDFEKIGMVRSLDWADLDGDKTPELVVAGEWMPVTIFKNSDGKLTNATAQFGLEKWSGFWRSACAADFDDDGDLDLVCGNLGKNSRHLATPESPLRLYARDFDSNGSIDPIMTLTQHGNERPIAQKTLMLKQLPVLKKKFVRTRPYAEALVNDLFSSSELEKSQRLEVTELANVYFENKNGKFEMRPLPTAAQVFPANAIVAFDANRDGHLDLVLAGNDYGQQIETGRLDAGNGCILLGDGKGNFKALMARESGFWATLDARKLCVLDGKSGKKVVLVGNSNGVLQAFEF